MCGRYTLAALFPALAEHFGIPDLPDPPDAVELKPRFNIAPSQQVPAVRRLEENDSRTIDTLRWGLVPFWAKDPKIGYRMINARAETVAEKPSYRQALIKRRCLLPADGFYEWKKEEKRKQPYYFRLQDGGVFAFAGLWEKWKDEEGVPLETCTIITTTPNEVVGEVHQRMPVILSPSDYDTWLDPEVRDRERLVSLLRPYPPELMDSYAVGLQVNSPKNDDPSCVRPPA